MEGEIESTLNEARGLAPTSPEPLQALASLRQQQGKDEEALQVLKQSMAMWFKPASEEEESEEEEGVEGKKAAGGGSGKKAAAAAEAQVRTWYLDCGGMWAGGRRVACAHAMPVCAPAAWPLCSEYNAAWPLCSEYNALPC